MAATTRALTPTQAGPFLNSLEPASAAKLAATALHRSVSPKSPRAMSPRISPGATVPAEETDPKLPSSEEAARVAKQAASQLSQPLQEIARNLTASENVSTSQGPAVSLSGFDSSSATTTT